MEEDEEPRERGERKADYLLQAFTLLRRGKKKKKDGRVFPRRLIRQNVSEKTTPSHPPFNLLHTHKEDHTQLRLTERNICRSVQKEEETVFCHFVFIKTSNESNDK